MADKQSDYTLLGSAVMVGFIGGLLGSIFCLIMYYFNFSEVAPNFYLFISIINKKWPSLWISYLVSIVLASIYSIFLAILYYALFRKVNSIWIGLLYGILLWVVVFVFLQPLYPNVQKLQDMNNNTIVSTVSLFGLYGTFIGYSISHDYFDMLKQPDKVKH